MFTLKFETTNDAFKEVYPEMESARILERAAAKLMHGEVEGVLKDGNGNTVGTFKLEED
jgi:hypothetical protein